MKQRLAVGISVLAIGFGAMVVATSGQAGAYSPPSPALIDTLATVFPGSTIADSVTSAAGDLVYSDYSSSVVKFVPAVSGTYFGKAMAGGVAQIIAGNGTAGYSGDGGPGPQSQLNHPHGVAIDSAGDVWIADTSNNVIRVVPNQTGVIYNIPYETGKIYTAIGTGTAGYSGDGGPGIYAELNAPNDLTMDGDYNLVIADSGNSVVRFWSLLGGTFFGADRTGANIYTIAGTGTAGYSGDGGAALSAQLNVPNGIAVNAGGDAIISDSSNNRIRVVAASTHTLYGVTISALNIDTVAGNGSTGYGGDDVAATSAPLTFPTGADDDGNGNLLIADTFATRVRVVAAATGTYYGHSFTANRIYTLAGDGTAANTGDGGAAYNAEVYAPTSVGVDASDDVIISSGDHIRIIGAGNPTGDLAVSSSVDPGTLTPPDSTAAQWTVSVYNQGVGAQNVQATFDVDLGLLNMNYFSVSQGTGCSFPGAGEIPTTEAICDLGSLAPGATATATVQILAKNVKAPNTIHGTVVVDPGSVTDSSDVTVSAPTPGEVVAFTTGAKGEPALKTDKVTNSTTATIIGGFKVARFVDSSFQAAGANGGANPSVLVNNLGAVVTMQRVDAASNPTLCNGDCIGAIMTIQPFVNQNDPFHPATLTLSWDYSLSVGAYSSTALWMLTDAPGAVPVQLPATCLKSRYLGYTNLPCIKKITQPIVGTIPSRNKGYKFQVLMLSSNDPSFARR